MKVFGLAGWRNSGKTTLMVRLVSLLTDRGLKISTVKHADLSFDIDQPGKDSHRHRTAGATPPTQWPRKDDHMYYPPMKVSTQRGICGDAGASQAFRNDARAQNNPGRRWGKTASRMRRDACPMSHIAPRAAPTRETVLPHQIASIWPDSALKRWSVGDFGCKVTG